MDIRWHSEWDRGLTMCVTPLTSDKCQREVIHLFLSVLEYSEKHFPVLLFHSQSENVTLANPAFPLPFYSEIPWCQCGSWPEGICCLDKCNPPSHLILIFDNRKSSFFFLWFRVDFSRFQLSCGCQPFHCGAVIPLVGIADWPLPRWQIIFSYKLILLIRFTLLLGRARPWNMTKNQIMPTFVAVIQSSNVTSHTEWIYYSPAPCTASKTLLLMDGSFHKF